MNLLEQELQTLRPSKPIFKLKLDTRWSGESKYINFEPADSSAYKGNDSTPIGKLVKANFYESFGAGRYTVDIGSIRNRCVSDISKTILDFLERYSPQKNPTKTTVYQWYYKAVWQKYTDSFLTSAINLYVYMKNKGDELLIEGSKTPAGIVAALDLLYNKHKNDFPTEYARALEPRQRRRRRRRL